MNRTNALQTPEIAIAPEPDDSTRAAIGRAVAETHGAAVQSAWAEAALAEGVGVAADDD